MKSEARIAFQLKHGLGGTGGLASFGEFLAGQLAIGGPVLFPLALAYAVRRAWAVLPGSRYDLWPEPAVAPGQDALWFSQGAPPPEELALRFTTVEGPVELPADFRGQRVHTFHVWRLRSARSEPHAPPPEQP